jgi:hypothetical protein
VSAFARLAEVEHGHEKGNDCRGCRRAPHDERDGPRARSRHRGGSARSSPADPVLAGVFPRLIADVRLCANFAFACRGSTLCDEYLQPLSFESYLS